MTSVRKIKEKITISKQNTKTQKQTTTKNNKLLPNTYPLVLILASWFDTVDMDMDMDDITHNPTPINHTQTPVNNPLPQFLIFRSAELDGAGKNLPLKLNPFQIEEALSKLGRPSHVFRNSNGEIEARFTRDLEIKKALAADRLQFRVHGRGLTSTPVIVVEHPRKNSVQGVITCPEINSLSEEEIAMGLSRDGVTNVKHIMKTTDNKRIPTNTVILTFRGSKIPDNVHVGYILVRVRPYIPDPVRCFRCQSFGHTTHKCRGDAKCAKCASTLHCTTDCNSLTTNCANCSGTHPVWSRRCPTFLREKEILTIRTTNRISHREAAGRYNETHPSRSYSAAATQPIQTSKPSATSVALSRDTKLDRFRELTVGDFLDMLSRFPSRDGMDNQTASPSSVESPPVLSSSPSSAAGREQQVQASVPAKSALVLGTHENDAAAPQCSPVALSTSWPGDPDFDEADRPTLPGYIGFLMDTGPSRPPPQPPPRQVTSPASPCSKTPILTPARSMKRGPSRRSSPRVGNRSKVVRVRSRSADVTMRSIDSVAASSRASDTLTSISAVQPSSLQ